jgi:hypothetical protein
MTAEDFVMYHYNIEYKRHKDDTLLEVRLSREFFIVLSAELLRKYPSLKDVKNTFLTFGGLPIKGTPRLKERQIDWIWQSAEAIDVDFS